MQAGEYDLAHFLVDSGVSLTPRIPVTKKPPRGFPLSEYLNGSKILTWEELRENWKAENFAAVTGVNHLVGFDFDAVPDYWAFWDSVGVNLHNETLSVKTSRGIQNWFFDFSSEVSKFKSVINGSPFVKLEIFTKNHLLAVPGNLHPCGHKYELLGTSTILRKDGIVWAGIERLKSLHWIGEIYEPTDDGSFESGDLSQEIEDFEKSVHLLAQHWKRGYRNRLLIALSGVLIRENISEEAAVKLVRAVIEATSDSEARLNAPAKMRYLYKHREKAKRLQGIPALLSLFKEIEAS